LQRRRLTHRHRTPIRFSISIIIFMTSLFSGSCSSITHLVKPCGYSLEDTARANHRPLHPHSGLPKPTVSGQPSSTNNTYTVHFRSVSAEDKYGDLMGRCSGLARHHTGHQPFFTNGRIPI
jgi:hypothetical protein